MKYFEERPRCPACYSEQFISLFSCSFENPPIRQYIESFYGPEGRIEYQYLRETNFILSECKRCGLVFQKAIPNDFLMKKLYQNWLDPEPTFIKQVMDRRDLNYHINDAGEVMMIVAYLRDNPSNLSFFDFGMGWGSWALMAKAFGCKAYGSELSKIKLDYCISQGITPVQWGDLVNYKFDFINAEQVFEHISNPLDSLIHLAKALDPKHGLIKISVPDGNNIIRKVRIADWTAKKYSKNSLNAVSPLEHINCFSRNSLLRMAKLAGLREVKIPLSLQYTYGVNWEPFRPLAYTLLRPFYRNILKKGTTLFFTKAYL
ncbi:MAG: class I SAM-dependent methyltransferase [Candidatus Bathyarchaeota archaeon]|nr:class I SAM-dependent methyltransferase [Candidatus Bathyarchaeota archaeon]